MGTDKRNLLCFGGLISLLRFFVFSPSSSHAYPCKFRDARGVEIVIQKRPVRVVSVVPSVTEIIFKLGAGDALKGITYYSTYLRGASKKRKEENQVIKDGIFRSRPVDFPLRYVEKATVAYSHIHDFVNKTLIIDLSRLNQK